MIQVSPDLTKQMQVLRRIAESIPSAAPDVAAAKKRWWALVRQSHNIPSGVKLTVRLPSGTLVDKATKAPYQPSVSSRIRRSGAGY